MRKAKELRQNEGCGWALPVMLALAAAVGLAHDARGAGFIKGSYTLNWDGKTTYDGPDVNYERTIKHALDVTYKGFLDPVITNEIQVKAEQSIDAQDKELTKISPIITLGYKGSYWNAGAKRTIDETDEPGKNVKISDSYFVEVLLSAPRATLPDFKGKYTLDKDTEKGATDTTKSGLTLSSKYKPFGWAEIGGDYTRNLTMDHLKEDSDTAEEKISATIGIRHFVGTKIRLSSEYRFEKAAGATLLTGGGTTNRKEDWTHTWKNALTFRVFEDTSIEASYDMDLKQNMAIKSEEYTLTKTPKVSLTQRVGILDAKVEFFRTITEIGHTVAKDDNSKSEDTFALTGKAKFSKMLDFNVKLEDKKTTETHFLDHSKDTSSGSKVVGVTWTGEMTPFWKAYVAYDKTDTFKEEVRTTVDTKYSLKSTFDFKTINLNLEPIYDITFKDDYVLNAFTVVRDFKAKLTYKLLPTRTIDFKADHTYGRKVDTAQGTIERTDTTNANVTVLPAPGWTFGLDFTRTGTDTSENDTPPDIASTFTVKLDYKYQFLALNTSFKYDKKKLGDDSETFDAKVVWTAYSWDFSLSYSFAKTFSLLLNEMHTVSLAFKYNI